jgi:hypothetical protein
MMLESILVSPMVHLIPGKKIADYWDTSKKLLMDSYFINRLKEYDRDNIPVSVALSQV